MGNKNSGRPGGNPDIRKYAFKTDRKESLTKQMNVRVAPSMLEKLQAQENWHEFVRQAIEKALAEVEEEKNIKSA
ncbi:MAG: hypothetical protein QNJ54_22880 [Prochloraceae cyanobacterium]|nr:hypothetical protein [Prochloraceae cyanobacterium]